MCAYILRLTYSVWNNVVYYNCRNYCMVVVKKNRHLKKSRNRTRAEVKIIFDKS